MNFCPQCGAKMTDPDAKFCSSCGAPFSQGTAGESFSGSAPSHEGGEGLLQRPKPAPAPAARPASGSGGPPTGITGSFSSPFVKDTVPAPKSEPLFSPVFAEDGPLPASKSPSLFDQDAPVPVQSPRPAPSGEAPLSPAAAAPSGGSAFSFESSGAPAAAPSSAPASFTGAGTPTAEPPAQPGASLFEDAAPLAETTAQPGASLFEDAAPLADTTTQPGASLFEDAAPLADTTTQPGASLFEDAAPLVDTTTQPGASLFEDAAPLAETTAQPGASLFEDAAPLADNTTQPGASLFEDAAPLAETATQPGASLFEEAAPRQSRPQPAAEPAAQKAAHTPAHKEPAHQPARQVYPGAAKQSAPQQVVPTQSAAPAQQDLLSPQPAQSAPVQRIPDAERRGSLLADGAVGARRPQRQAPLPPEPAHRPQRDTGRKVRNVLLLILVALILLFGAILGFLYWQNRPSQAIDAFTQALAARDYEALSSTVIVTGVTSSGSEGWIALCDAFQDDASRAALSKEMARVSANPAKSNFTYPSVRLEGKPLFLFIKQYQVRLSGVGVLVPGAAEGSSLRLGAGNEFSDPPGVLDAEGMLYEGIMPGLYTATVSAPDGSTASYTLSAFQTTQPNRVEDPAAPPAGEAQPVYANLTIQNCLSDDAQILINGQETPAKPSGGVVQLQQVALGATISIRAVKDGATSEASVTFTDPAVTTLSFGEYTLVEGAAPAPTDSLSADQAQAVLTSFYKSYLEAINTQSLANIQNSTEANNKNLQSRIATPANQANTYTFVSAQVDPATLTTTEENGVVTATFTATCSFSYVAKENPGAPETGSNKQSVRLVQQNGQWLVDSFTNA